MDKTKEYQRLFQLMMQINEDCREMDREARLAREIKEKSMGKVLKFKLKGD